MWLTSDLDKSLTPTGVALGNFDGVHIGHKQVVKPVLNDDQIYGTVISFNPHPKEFFTGQPRQLLTPIEEKVQQLKNLGVKQLILLPFDRELARLSPEEFVQNILVEKLQVQKISVGEDFCFGKQRTGTAKYLQAIALKYDIDVSMIPLQTLEGERISSSHIRQALQIGNMEKANKLLGRSYTLTGQVIYGNKLGRTIGFPTANLEISPDKFLPKMGVYAVNVNMGNHQTNSVPGVMNIGTRPTINGSNCTIEVHLFNWNDNLYGETLTVNIEKFLRPEQKFSSLDELKSQISKDCEQAKIFLGTYF
ncbi:MAG TPA: bifunctional riboflavin kinase/FAD synthetase [Allocoleopsis sp.]